MIINDFLKERLGIGVAQPSVKMLNSSVDSTISCFKRSTLGICTPKAGVQRKSSSIGYPKAGVQRVQSGFFHVWIRGSNRYNVFYSDNDFVDFLERCQSSALKNKTVISAFVLMDNHVHLQLYTNCLNQFMSSLLISFCQRYNRIWKMSGQVFSSPFSSSPIYSLEVLEKNLLYIFANPVMAGICNTARDYKWSSYHFIKSPLRNPVSDYIFIDKSIMKFLFDDSRILSKRCEEFLREDYCPKFAGAIDKCFGDGDKDVLNQRISGGICADNNGDISERGVCEDKFANVGYVFDWGITNLKRGVSKQNGGLSDVGKSDVAEDNFNYEEDLIIDDNVSFDMGIGGNKLNSNMLFNKEIVDTDMFSNRSINNGLSNKVSSLDAVDKKTKKRFHATDNEVAIYLKKLLRGRNIGELSKSEFHKIIKILRYSCNATFRQISSVTHENYYYIIRLLR